MATTHNDLAGRTEAALSQPGILALRIGRQPNKDEFGSLRLLTSQKKVDRKVELPGELYAKRIVPY